MSSRRTGGLFSTALVVEAQQAARHANLAIPHSLLLRADEIIQ